MFEIVRTDGTPVGVCDEVRYIKVNSPYNTYIAAKGVDDAEGIALLNSTYKLYDDSPVKGETVTIKEVKEMALYNDIISATNSTVESNSANILYLSMMTGVDLEFPEDGLLDAGEDLSDSDSGSSHGGFIDPGATTSANYIRIKGYYDAGYWSEAYVKTAVEKGWLTETEYGLITGKQYEA